MTEIQLAIEVGEKLTAALRAIQQEARKGKPNVDKIHLLATDALEGRP